MKAHMRLSLSLLLSALILLAAHFPAIGQEGPFEDPFDNPELPGWERSPNVSASEGLLRIPEGGFASPHGAWGTFHLSMRAHIAGPGEMALIFNTHEGGASILLFNAERIQLQREGAGEVVNLGEPAFVGMPEGEWFNFSMELSEAEQQVWINDDMVFSMPFEGELIPGGIAIENVGGSVLEIDRIEIIPLQGPPGIETQPDEAEPEEPEPAAAETRPVGELEWVRLGGPPGGLGYDIRYNFDEPNIWYVTDANAGVFISTDDGLTWQQSNTGINTAGGASGDAVPIFSLTVDPHDPSIIWAGTDMSGQIYKSTDGGATWEEKDQGVIQAFEILLSFRGFTVDPRTSDTVYAMGELQRPGNNVWGLGVGGVVYKTTNGGDSWTRIWYGPIPASLARYMWINPENPEILYVSTGIFDRGAVGETDPDTNADPFGGLGILKSTDGGQTWNSVGKENGLDFLYVGTLYMHPDDPDVLLAGTGHVVSELALQSWLEAGHTPMGVYRTTDGGETWTQVLEAPRETMGEVFSSVEMCPSDPSIVYAGTDSSVYRSEDGGLTWRKLTGGPGGWGPPGVRAGWPIDMQCDPQDTDRVFANNYSGGNFLSEDGGVTWVNASDGYSGAQIIQVAVDPYNPARVFAGGRSGGWVSEDGGLTWGGIHNPGEMKALAGGEVAGVAVDPSQPNHILIGSGEYILEWVPEEGRWQPHFYEFHYGGETSVIAFAPSDASTVYAASANHNTMVHAESYEAGFGVLRSRDGGTTWTPITGEEFAQAMVTDLAIDPRDAGMLYVATYEGLFATSDYGDHWTEVQVQPGDVPVRSVGVDPTDPDHMLAGIPGRGLFRSQDGGVTWGQVSAGLEPNGNHRDILYDPAHPGVVYTSDIVSGIYRSDDAGETWQKLDAGLTNRAATGLSLSQDGLHLYAGTSGGGVFRLDLNGKPPASTGVTLFEGGEMGEPDQVEGEAALEGEEPREADQEQPEPEEPAKTGGGLSLPCLGATLPALLFATTALVVESRRGRRRL
jgi:photosystem II stability/assembly factor-like uncharacterized protein